jgi:hypothetical protein
MFNPHYRHVASNIVWLPVICERVPMSVFRPSKYKGGKARKRPGRETDSQSVGRWFDPSPLTIYKPEETAKIRKIKFFRYWAPAGHCRKRAEQSVLLHTISFPRSTLSAHCTFKRLIRPLLPRTFFARFRPASTRSPNK